MFLLMENQPNFRHDPELDSGQADAECRLIKPMKQQCKKQGCVKAGLLL